MIVVHLTSSRFFGGPERQMLGLAQQLSPDVSTAIVSFSETGLCQPFLDEVRRGGFEGVALKRDTPHLVASLRELTVVLRRLAADILCCHGYKANLLGLLATRRLGIPVVSISRGWTAENGRIRLYEWLDRRVLRRMDRVVCVSECQARKVRRTGVAENRITVIHNAVCTKRFASPPDPMYRQKLMSLFPTDLTHIVGAAGRLSPEKGFDLLVQACQQLADQGALNFGVVLFGDGPMRDKLQEQINKAVCADSIVLAGFTDELDRYMPHFDVFIQSSHTEGLPNVLLEAAAAEVPVVATQVGGTAEVVADGRTGVLVPPNDAAALGAALRRLLDASSDRAAMGQAAAAHIAEKFSFVRQAQQYRVLLESICSRDGSGHV